MEHVLTPHERGLIAAMKDPSKYRFYVCVLHGLFFEQGEVTLESGCCWHCGNLGDEYAPAEVDKNIFGKSLEKRKR